MNAVDDDLVKVLFLEKCIGKGIVFNEVGQLFPSDLISTLEPHLEDLTRMTADPIPPLKDMINELKNRLRHVFT